MSNGDDHNRSSHLISPIVDEVGILPRDNLAYAVDFLFAPGVRKQQEILERLIDGGAHPNGGFWISFSKVVGDFGKVPAGTACKAKLHRSKRRNAASTSASVANSPRLASARPSSTSARCAGSI